MVHFSVEIGHVLMPIDLVHLIMSPFAMYCCEFGVVYVGKTKPLGNGY